MLKNKLIGIFAVFSLIFTFTLPSLAQVAEKAIDIKVPSRSTPKKASGEEAGLANVLLWEVTYPGSTNKSYFAGTVHLPFRDGFTVPSYFLDHIQECDQFVDEIDLSDISGMPLLVYKYGFDQEANVNKKLSPEKWKLLVNRLKKKGLEEKVLKILKPWYLVLILQMEDLIDEEEIKKPLVEKDETGKLVAHSTMDALLQENARENELEIVHLETAEEQVQILSNALSNQEYIKMLDGLLGLPALKKSLTKKDTKPDISLVDAYNKNDINNFLLISKATEEYSQKYYDALIRIRNEKWINRLDQMLLSINLFVAVGALHLVGDKGILKALEKQGYKVNFIPLNKKNH
jgi:uncharacterized protein YbaP (TraB family)